MRTITKLLVLSIVLAIAAGVCVSAPKGNLKIAGSTTVLPLATKWAEEFMSKFPDVNISVSGGGTGVGISSLMNGTCDIASASREAKPKEIETARQKNQKLVGTRVAKDGIAIVVHPSNDIKTLTMSQIAAIYSGKVDNWSQVGGEKLGIVAIGRDSSSGTYGFFQEAVLGGRPYRKDMLSLPTNAAVAHAVSQSKGAIGYVGMAYAWDMSKKGKVKVLYVSRKSGDTGMLPTDENIASGAYPLFRYLYMYTSGSPRGLAKSFINYCLSPEGQKSVKEVGYLPLR
ncbi:MAG: phosphate ABC transporter substrate-binding protein [Armatimonadetes bacterium]|nr:phosphate ABC transporter substrate-binding protein [Armatimonadota bacterium]